MSEPAVKRRLRAAKRNAQRKLGENKNIRYQFSVCSAGPYHLIADTTHKSRRIIFVFHPIQEADIKKAEAAACPRNSRVELWRVASNGRQFFPHIITKKAIATGANYAAVEPQRQEHIYFLLNRQKNAVKIGRTLNVVRRYRELSHHTFDDLELLAEMPVVCAVSNEKQLHKRFRHLRIRGEWFKYCDEIREFLNSVKPNA